MHASIFSSNFVQPAGSPIRELFPYLGQHGLISFAGGYPSPALFDSEGLQLASQKAFRAGASMYQYGPTEGMASLRETLVAHMAPRGIVAPASQVLVTSGSQQAFDLLVRTLIDPGDVVLVETPSYPATLQALRLANAKIVAVPTDAQGLDMVQLRAVLATLGEGRRVKMLYTVPTFSNPGGTLLSLERRMDLMSLARAHGFFIVEDDPYGELTFRTDIKPKTLWAIGNEQFGQDNPVVYLSSLSKTVAPALRTGWMVAHPEVVRRCAIAKQTADLCTSSLTQLVAHEYLQLGRYEASIRHAASVYGQRMNAMADGLRTELADCVRFVEPDGGLFLWIELTRPTDLAALFQAAVRENVLYVPGSAFFPDPKGEGALRLSFASPNENDIREGVRRLRRAFDAVAI